MGLFFYGAKKMKIDESIKSCAVVGNSPGIIGTQYGKEIDRHEMVFRCNAAMIDGYEQDVGSRTDYRLMNIHICNWISKGGVQKHEEHLNKLDPTLIVKNGEKIVCKDYKSEGEIIREYNQIKWNMKKLYGIDCDSYYMPKIALETFKIWPHVSSGTYATALARWLFPNAEINVYGFSFYSGQKEESHYFEKLENKKLCHDFKRDFEEFQKIPNVTRK